MRLLSVLHGTLTVSLHVHCSPLDQHLVQFVTAAAYGPRLGHTEFYESVDQYRAHWLHSQSPASVLCASFVRAFEAASVAESSCRNVMVEVVANSVAWSRRVFASSDARRICISADEFNRESSRMILKGKGNAMMKKKGHMMKTGACHYMLPSFHHFAPFVHQKCHFGVLMENDGKKGSK